MLIKKDGKPYLEYKKLTVSYMFLTVRNLLPTILLTGRPWVRLRKEHINCGKLQTTGDDY